MVQDTSTCANRRRYVYDSMRLPSTFPSMSGSSAHLTQQLMSWLTLLSFISTSFKNLIIASRPKRRYLASSTIAHHSFLQPLTSVTPSLPSDCSVDLNRIELASFRRCLLLASFHCSILSPILLPFLYRFRLFARILQLHPQLRFRCMTCLDW